MIKIRKAESRDAEQIVQVIKNAEDSGYMMFNPGERQISAESFVKFIDVLNANEKSGVFIACEEHQVLGYLIVQHETPQRISHRAYIVAGVYSDSRGKGVGKALFSHMISWAKSVQLHRLELTVIAENTSAVALYQNMGFEIEGVKRDSLLVNDGYVDEYYMAKLL
ncbi:GNAT family N-acetyltransferase [Planococcus dechangensis]|uniref:GNAT family N-acetyltransferase n=1 Tax=Planococcus dechangensis TaxID=1176255 RepID=A0ABV9MEI6_9BACL